MKKKLDITELLDRPVDVLGLIEELAFDPDNVEQAAIKQPDLYLEAARWRVQQMRHRAKMMSKLERVTAEIGLRVRGQKYSGPRGGRPPEGMIKDTVSSNPRVRKARLKVERAYQREEFGKALAEAFRQRDGIVRLIGKLRESEMSNQIRSVKNRMAADDMSRRASRVRKKYEDIGEDD